MNAKTLRDRLRQQLMIADSPPRGLRSWSPRDSFQLDTTAALPARITLFNATNPPFRFPDDQARTNMNTPGRVNAGELLVLFSLRLAFAPPDDLAAFTVAAGPPAVSPWDDFVQAMADAYSLRVTIDGQAELRNWPFYQALFSQWELQHNGVAIVGDPQWNWFDIPDDRAGPAITFGNKYPPQADDESSEQYMRRLYSTRPRPVPIVLTENQTFQVTLEANGPVAVPQIGSGPVFLNATFDGLQTRNLQSLVGVL